MMFVAAVAFALLLADEVSAAASAPSATQAQRAVTATLALIPGDDIQHGYRPLQIRVADLDGDGTSEIVYVYSATYTGGSFEKANELMVMTPLGPEDTRGSPAYPGTSTVMDADHAAVRASGYADDVGEHIPGTLEDLQVVDGAIRVTFTAVAGSPLCFEAERSRPGQEPCPAAGRHVWTFRWSRGELRRDPLPPG